MIFGPYLPGLQNLSPTAPFSNHIWLVVIDVKIFDNMTIQVDMFLFAEI